MNNEEPLTLFQRAKLCDALLLGCNRETACHFVGAAAAQLQRDMDRDDALARTVARAEAHAELRHMTNVHKASLDEKNWRTSVWWLEQRAAARAAQTAGAESGRLAELVDSLAQSIVAEVADVSVQRRLIERLWKILDGRDEPAPFVVEGKVLSGPEPTADDASADDTSDEDSAEDSP